MIRSRPRFAAQLSDSPQWNGRCAHPLLIDADWRSRAGAPVPRRPMPLASKLAPSQERWMYRFSQRLAWIAGVVLPVGETFRRWGTWWDVPAAYLDDVVIGIFLLAGAWMSRQGQAGARW